MFRVVLPALAALVLSAPAVATEILKISKDTGAKWAVGDRSSKVVTSDGRLGITMTVKTSPNTRQSYYVFAFETQTGMPVNFSARVADRPPQRTHFAARAEPAKPYMWGEHLPAELDAVFVMYRPSK